MPDELETIHPRLFEELMAEIFHRLGCEVELTKATRDGGRDIVAVRNAIVSERFLIECKRRKRVGIGPVRELYGVRVHEGATKAILATTGRFTAPARDFINQHIWELEGRDREGILDWIRLCLQQRGGR